LQHQHRLIYLIEINKRENGVFLAVLFHIANIGNESAKNHRLIKNGGILH